MGKSSESLASNTNLHYFWLCRYKVPQSNKSKALILENTYIFEEILYRAICKHIINFKFFMSSVFLSGLQNRDTSFSEEQRIEPLKYVKVFS